MESEIFKIKERIKELDEIIKESEEKLKELKAREEELRNEETVILAKIGLYENALKLIQNREDKCPLCECGIVTRYALDRKKFSLECKLDEMRDRIAQILREKYWLLSLINEREYLIKKLKEMKSKTH